MFSIKSAAVLVFATVAVIVAPWVHVLATCPGAASGTCGTTTESSACGCTPTGGYKSCDGLAQSVCSTSQGHEIFSSNWECSDTSDLDKKCINANAAAACWKKYACKWLIASTSKCIYDIDGGILDQAGYVPKQIASCSS